MHDIKWIRDNPEAFDRALARRGLAGEAQRLIEIDERRRAAIQKAEAAQARRNAASREIGAAKKSDDQAAAEKLMAEVAALKDAIPKLEAEEKKLSKELEEALAQIPNLPLDEVPNGKDEKDNVEHHHFGAKRNYAFAPKQHFELGEALGPDGFRDRRQAFRRALCRVEKWPRAARTGVQASSCSICIRASMAIRRSIRRCWCVMKRCSARRNCRSSRTINLPQLESHRRRWQMRRQSRLLRMRGIAR